MTATPIRGTEPGLRSALGPPPLPNTKFEFSRVRGRTVSRGYRTHSVPTSEFDSALDHVNHDLGGQKVTWLSLWAFCAPPGEPARRQEPCRPRGTLRRARERTLETPAPP